MTAEPKLAAPGAGLPWYQNLFLRYWMGPVVASGSTWEQSAESCERIHRKLLSFAQGINPSLLATKVLVKPLPGLEDSSRFWSAAMVLEHVMIVDRSIIGILIELSQGSLPQQQASTAAVKPLGQRDPLAVLQEFHDFSADLTETIEKSVINRTSKLKFEHPWFGPFSLQQWHWLLGTHGLIHYRQLKNIEMGLREAE